MTIHFLLLASFFLLYWSGHFMSKFSWCDYRPDDDIQINNFIWAQLSKSSIKEISTEHIVIKDNYGWSRRIFFCVANTSSSVTNFEIKSSSLFSGIQSVWWIFALFYIENPNSSALIMVKFTLHCDGLMLKILMMMTHDRWTHVCKRHN